MRISDMPISNNTASGAGADQGGGGIYNLSGTVVLTGSTSITNNRANGASGSGGGILVDAGAMLEAYGTEHQRQLGLPRRGVASKTTAGTSTTLRLAQIRLLNNTTGSAPWQRWWPPHHRSRQCRVGTVVR